MSMHEIDSIFQNQKTKAQSNRLESVENRIDYLKKLQKSLLHFESEIIEAHLADFKKPANETLLTEIYPVNEEIHLFLRKLRCWSRPQRVATPALLFGSKSRIHFEPKGRILVIAPWNYPFNLSLVPLVGAIGAGNTVILKPSELTPSVSKVISKIIQDVFPPELVSVVEGGVEVSQKLLELSFDHIFFTGSTNVGRIVMQAAAKNLTPVTLELGGKSPVIVDSSAKLKDSAEKIIWGKTVNSGQTCVSPDYVYVQSQIWDAFVEECKIAIKRFHEAHQRPQIITEKHYQRQLELKTKAVAQGARILAEGITSGARDLSTVLIEVTPQQFKSDLMQDEIFGPLLPFIKYQRDEEVVDHINSQGKPLSLYLFSENQQQIQFWLKSVSSGGVTINNTLLHLGNHHLPFGGIGTSGMGKYHGHSSFLEFSHQRSVLNFRFAHQIFKRFYPPYLKGSANLMSKLVHLLSKIPL